MSNTELLSKLHQFYPLPREDCKRMVLSFIIWTSMYVVVNNMPLLFKPKHIELKRIDDLDVRNRMISFIHGMILLFFSGY